MTTTTTYWVSTGPCMVCGNSASVELSEDEHTALQQGWPVQEALPTRDADFRELFISGTHAHCWEALMGDEEE